jgi:large subunit ribosomal protein L10
LNREEKSKEVERLKSELGRAGTIFVMAFDKLKVSEDLELRHQVRAAGGRYFVVKNTLAKLGSEGTPAEPVLKDLKGPTSLALTELSPVVLAKALTAYAKANPNFSFRAGVVEGRVISLGDISAIAVLPSREELLAKVMYLVASPARRLATTLQAVTRNLASVMDQAVKEGKFQQ